MTKIVKPNIHAFFYLYPDTLYMLEPLLKMVWKAAVGYEYGPNPMPLSVIIDTFIYLNMFDIVDIKLKRKDFL